MASPANSSTVAGGSEIKKPRAIDVMLHNLGIDEDECDDLISKDQEEAPKEGLKWMALAKVHTSNVVLRRLNTA